MSRSYRIRIPIEVLLSSDRLEKLGRFTMPFDLMQILSPERMLELLKQALLRAGCSEVADGIEVPSEKGETAIIDLENLKIRLEVNPPRGYDITVEDEMMAVMQSQINRALQQGSKMDEHLSASADRLLSDQMARSLRDLAMAARKVLNSAIKEAYSEAIKEKAAQLGNISNISENSDGNTTRIRIEVSI